MSTLTNIPTVGPFIYDIANRSVRNIEILTMMRRWVLSGEETADAATLADTRISIEKEGNGPIEIKATYDFGAKFAENFHATVTASSHIVNVSIEGNNFISISWQGSNNNYPIKQWLIPIQQVGTMTVNKS